MNLHTLASLLLESKNEVHSPISEKVFTDTGDSQLNSVDTSGQKSFQSSEVFKDITGFCIDSRILEPGNLFIAIQGEHFDGHKFVLDAQAKGAIGAVVNQFIAGVRMPQFLVSDSLQALATLATYHRSTMHCPVIALTGSNGKTTVKEMIAAILPTPSHATHGNLNNHIGAPLSVLKLQDTHQYAVFELGANRAGDIAYTVAMVQPEVTLINNIAPAHIEGFGSIDGVAVAKGEIHAGLAFGGTAVINDDDSYAHFWDEMLVDKQVLRFSSVHPRDIYARDLCLDAQGRGHFSLITPKGKVDISLLVPGLHNVQNALAAAACAYAVGISAADIQRGLSQFKGVPGRMTFLTGKNQSVVIDDTYNANLRSVLTALDVLSKYPGKKIFVFGDMGELGSWTEQHHHEVGLSARQLGIDMLFSCGIHSAFASKAFDDSKRHFVSQDELVQDLLEELTIDTTVLVKGSRSSAMENIVYKLLNG
ncbi:MAG: UDP-N-acetylmuramoyl-tripeptide--D-alanyl-D-alanine ligase [Legionella sp.]|nr:UDP-N-acetylmuramoyl-tripeptide--D-alanyl-D-alanine ligase [Legionella sp.]